MLEHADQALGISNASMEGAVLTKSQIDNVEDFLALPPPTANVERTNICSRRTSPQNFVVRPDHDTQCLRLPLSLQAASLITARRLRL